MPAISNAYRGCRVSPHRATVERDVEVPAFRLIPREDIPKPGHTVTASDEARIVAALDRSGSLLATCALVKRGKNTVRKIAMAHGFRRTGRGPGSRWVRS